MTPGILDDLPRGRPKLPPEEKKQRYEIWLPPAVFARVKEIAAAAGIEIVEREKKRGRKPKEPEG
jgi:hypothetical protein